ncbi:hypothetical protein RIF29_20492 [Crotalaria pallida]|uniref:Uncharacterized protein n=1 Tax=Crotalaria pallida TaxID=3830 RepID=A0AAN9F9T1_CROPI
MTQPTVMVEPGEDREIEPKDEEEEPATELDKDYVMEEGSDSDSDLTVLRKVKPCSRNSLSDDSTIRRRLLWTKTVSLG